MGDKNEIQISTTCILNIPFQTYGEDFVFIVNGKEFRTSRVISELLSPKICHLHLSDPTINYFTINTNHSGDFSHFLNLFNFKPITISESEMPFIAEVTEILCNESILHSNSNNIKLTINNVISQIKLHDKFGIFYSSQLQEDIDFISKHFNEIIVKEKKEEFLNISTEIFAKILANEKFQIESEDQLLRFLNHLYKSDSKYAPLYSFVIFTNVTCEVMNEFIEVFKFCDISNEIWSVLRERLKKDIKEEQKIQVKNRYTLRDAHLFSGNPFEGIIKFLRNKSKEQIQNEINITSSKLEVDRCRPENVIVYEDRNKYCWPGGESWICFEFLKYNVIPTGYSIRSCNAQQNNYIKSWVIEGLDNAGKWDTIDKQENSSVLKGDGFYHTFTIKLQQEKSYKSIRLRQIGPNWYSNNYFEIEAFELFGYLT